MAGESQRIRLSARVRAGFFPARRGEVRYSVKDSRMHLSELRRAAPRGLEACGGGISGDDLSRAAFHSDYGPRVRLDEFAQAGRTGAGRASSGGQEEHSQCCSDRDLLRQAGKEGELDE